MSNALTIPSATSDLAAFLTGVLKGTSPGELSIQAPNKYELVINLKTAESLGLTVPPTVLARATCY